MKYTKEEETARRRYCTVANQVVPVTIERRQDGLEPLSGELADITASGARVRLQEPLQFGEEFVLQQESEPFGLSITICSKVRWVRAGRNEDEWVVGCLFDSHLQPDLLEAYVDSGLLERREAERCETSLPATVRFELTGEEADADVSDIGDGGFCFRSQTAGEVGSRVRVDFFQGEAGLVEGRIKWQSANDGAYSVGCQWINRKGRDFARQLTADEEVMDEPTSRFEWGPKVIIGALVLTIGVILAWKSVALAVSG